MFDTIWAAEISWATTEAAVASAVTIIDLENMTSELEMPIRIVAWLFTAVKK